MSWRGRAPEAVVPTSRTDEYVKDPPISRSADIAHKGVTDSDADTVALVEGRLLREREEEAVLDKVGPHPSTCGGGRGISAQ
jgi:hypothetical protein